MIVLIVKEINELKDLDGFVWECNGYTFKIKHDTNVRCDILIVYLLEHELENGSRRDGCLLSFYKNNLSELKAFGLDVRIAEKPKLTQKEFDFLDCFDDDFCIARDGDGSLHQFSAKPIHTDEDFRYWDPSIGEITVLKKDIFKFITWDSGKVWSRKELLELEVED